MAKGGGGDDDVAEDTTAMDPGETGVGVAGKDGQYQTSLLT
jgi:hypothetical protein